MSAYISNFSNNYDNIRINKINKMEDAKMDSYVLRKQINYSISNCFIQKDVPNLQYFVPTLKQNLKSQAEELQKLQSEIRSVEEKIRDLEITKKFKLIKVIIIICFINLD